MACELVLYGVQIKGDIVFIASFVVLLLPFGEILEIVIGVSRGVGPIIRFGDRALRHRDIPSRV
jgi:hypothetical protein